MVGTAPRARKRVGAKPVSLKRGENGSGFTNCKKCRKAVPVGALDVHDCKLDVKIKLALECHHHPNRSTDKDLSQLRRKKRKNKEAEDAKTSRMTKKPRAPQAPKNPQTAFSIFMSNFRTKFKEGNADLKEVNKQGTEKWKSMTEEDKQPYNERADELRMEYERALAKYHKELRQFNEEGDSAEVGIIDMAYYESPYEDEYSYDGPDSDED
ncbi:hypothetical protein SUGI_1071710 [Cryptomeria japonica]|uniref:high mobility group B protein 3 n=1 Tax=Cryptomeria japonica TaxID=3369 RepID=UPI002414C9EF|nr:high mobility group B protein 3 [Cryptomeria japonica]GLJ50299.1 hypothetical protein SUGI_1071710 [Cryptomeria japonica]